MRQAAGIQAGRALIGAAQGNVLRHFNQRRRIGWRLG